MKGSSAILAAVLALPAVLLATDPTPPAPPAGPLPMPYPNAASPAGLEIPPHLLALETRVRAGLSTQERSRVQSVEARLSGKQSATTVAALTSVESDASIFAVMMAYLKLCQKEAREDQKLQAASRNLALEAKSAKLDQEAKKIAEQKEEAGEKYNHAMGAAVTGMGMGVVSGTGGAAAQFHDALARAEALAAKLQSPPPRLIKAVTPVAKPK